ncbi:MAG: diaminopimelate decarboxylase [Candidatus Methylomirabilia bacterium]
MSPNRRPYEPMALTRHTFGAVSKYSGVALNTRVPLVPTSVVDRIDGSEVTTLIRQFGSPLFVVSETHLRGELRAFREAFRALYPQLEVAYSYKTNYLSGVRAILHGEGAWAEVASGIEYEMAERLGVPGSRIVFNGPWKPEEDLRRAVKDGAWINIDNFDELSTLEEVARGEGVVPTVGLRVTARVTETPWEKFGFSLEAGLAEEACRRLVESRSLRLGGFHVHLGTELADPRMFGDLLKLLLPLMVRLEQRHGVRWEILDLGGGFPNRHRYARSHPGFSPEEVFPSFAQAIVRPLTRAFRKLQSRPRLILEPGRALVEHAVFLMTTVTGVKRLPSGVKAAVLDAGINLLPTACYTALDIAPTEPHPLSVEEVTLFGPLCMQVDCLASGLRLPPLHRGSPLVVKNCGAYTHSQSMQFIHARPPVVLVSSGHVELLREGEGIDDFLGHDWLPARLRQIPGRGR